MQKWVQVIVRFTPNERKMLKRAKSETGMTEKAILRKAFAQWDNQRKEIARTAE